MGVSHLPELQDFRQAEPVVAVVAEPLVDCLSPAGLLVVCGFFHTVYGGQGYLLHL